eukprot:gb/GEZN01003811.1/.p1 GENE.gb/GEZN01003811.1/~~gb/GEZN01003811.1/.p1  ORF type:complete len:658 (-),score=96.15 gb/GEZN01003811.1/:117-2048(-)
MSDYALRASLRRVPSALGMRGRLFSTSKSGAPAAGPLVKVRRALVSVSNKQGLERLGSFLHQHNVEILSTGGTAKALRASGIPVIDVAEYTQFPEMMGGRVKSLHPKIHGALLGIRDNAEHVEAMEQHQIKPIDLVVANLYPFKEVIARGGPYAELVENVDIGGPSMLRSAAKNHKHVTVVSDPEQYETLMGEMTEQKGGTTGALRQRLAQSAFALTSQYDAMIAQWLESELESPKSSEEPDLLPRTVERGYERSFNLKYGCNPHQKPAAIYKRKSDTKLPFTVKNGNPSYINMLDAANAYQLVAELRHALELPAAASFKHVSPAGAALGIPLTPLLRAVYEVPESKELTPLSQAYLRARQADPLCSFGDFVGLSHVVDEATALVLKSEVSDGVVAPGYEPAALEILKSKKGGGFVVLEADPSYMPPLEEFREVWGMGFAQRRNDLKFTMDHLKDLQVGQELTTSVKQDLMLAMVTLKYTQSNSVGYALGGQMVGVGAGQQSRVDCVKLAGRKVATWWLRQHPKVMGMNFRKGTKKQERVNARVRYIEGDMSDVEYKQWCTLFDEPPSPLTPEEKQAFMAKLTGVSLASDAFFPFRDGIDHASKFGVQYITQPGGSVRDEVVLDACKELGMSMVYSGVRAFHH